MKKIFSLFMVLLFAFGMTACGPAEIPNAGGADGATNTQTDSSVPTEIYAIEKPAYTFEQYVMGSTDVVVATLTGGEAEEDREWQFSVARRFVGDASVTEFLVDKSSSLLRVEGTDLTYRYSDLDFRLGKQYLLLLDHYAYVYSPDIYRLTACVFLPVDDFSAFEIYQDRAQNHMKANPQNIEEVYHVVEANLRTDGRLYRNDGVAYMRDEELLQYAAKDYSRLTNLKVVTLKALEVERTDAYGTMEVRCELNLLPGGEGEYLVRTVTFPKEAEIAVGGEYTVLLYHRPESNTPIVQESYDTYTGGYSPEVCQQYSKYSIWPAEDWLKIYTQFKNAQRAN